MEALYYQNVFTDHSLVHRANQSCETILREKMVYRSGQDKLHPSIGQLRSTIASIRHMLCLRCKVKEVTSNEHSSSLGLLDKLELLRADCFNFTV